MSGDMFKRVARPVKVSSIIMSERKDQILRSALDIIATEGYGKLTMRALGRAVGLKLGALQYHFPTWEELLRALAKHVSSEYAKSLELLNRGAEAPTIVDALRWYLQDSTGSTLRSDRLWPQLWAMAQVEPAMREALDDIFKTAVAWFEDHLAQAGSGSPRLEALALLSIGEGSLLFTGRGCPWEKEAEPLCEAMLEFAESRYGSRIEKTGLDFNLP